MSEFSYEVYVALPFDTEDECSELLINPIPPGLFEGGSAWGPIALKLLMKFGGVVKDH